MTTDHASVLIDNVALQTRVRELAAELSDTFKDAPSAPILVAVLKGSTLFLSDLMRAMSIDVVVDFMSISSYGEGPSSGVVRIIKDLEVDLSGRDVVLVEDIVDTGFTLTYLRRRLQERGPRSLSAVTLLDKSARRIVPVELERAGFEIPDVFVIGYGLDFQSRYRNLRDIFAVADLSALAKEPSLLVGSLFPRSNELDPLDPA